MITTILALLALGAVAVVAFLGYRKLNKLEFDLMCKIEELEQLQERAHDDKVVRAYVEQDKTVSTQSYAGKAVPDEQRPPPHEHDYKVCNVQVYDDQDKTVFTWQCTGCDAGATTSVDLETVAQLVDEYECTPEEARLALLKTCGVTLAAAELLNDARHSN